MSRVLLLSFVVILFFSAEAAPKAMAEEPRVFFTGVDLWGACKTDTLSLECQGYIEGIADAMSSNSGGIAGFKACFRNNLVIGQIVDVVKQWLQNHPELR